MYLKVTVYPGVKREKIVKKKADSWEVWVKEPAERNLANQRVKEIIAEQTMLDRKVVKLITGHRSNKKIFSLPDNVKE